MCFQLHSLKYKYAESMTGEKMSNAFILIVVPVLSRVCCTTEL